MQSVAAGGMETHAVDLAAEYARRGIETSVIVPRDAGLDGTAQRFESCGVAVHRLDTDARAGRADQVKQLKSALSLLRTLRPDVVHVQTGGATGGAAAVILGRMAGARVCITEHDVPSERPATSQRLARKLLDSLVHAIIAVSRRNGNLRFERLGGPPSRMAVILNGVPIDRPSLEVRAANSAAIRQELGIDADDFVVGSVVRLAEGKGLFDLLQAAGLLSTPLPWRIMLVGDGPLRERLQAQATELGIGERLILAGHRDDPERFVDGMDLFVLPVPAGSMSIALLEAMARGTPVLITFCGPEEAVIPGVSGYCAPPNAPKELGAAISAVMFDRGRLSEMGERGAAHVSKHFSVARVADDTIAVYRCARGNLPERLRLGSPPDPLPGERLVDESKRNPGIVGRSEPR